MAAAPVQVRIQGLDPKGVKAAAAPFCSAKNGLTTLSASGLRLNLSDSDYAVLAPGSLFLPFIQPTKRTAPQGCSAAQLLPSTTISCLAVNAKQSDQPYPCEVSLHTVIDLDDAAAIAQQLLSSHDLAFGWALAQPADNPSQLSSTSASFLAVLLPPHLIAQANLVVNHLADHLAQLANLLPHRIYCPGLPVSLIGSPFGCLAPRHFTNMTIQGIISAFLPANNPAKLSAQSGQHQENHKGMLLIDAHCLPGMEGAPIYTSDGDLLGLLCLPLTRGDTEVNVAITMHAIAEAAARLAAQSPYTDSPSNSQAANGSFTSQPAKLLPLLQQPVFDGSHGIPHSANTGYHVAGQQSSSISTSGVGSGGTDASLKPQALNVAPSTQGPTNGDWTEREETHPGVVLIKAGNSWASGVVASASGIVITSAHLFPSTPAPPPQGRKTPDSHISPFPALYPQAPLIRTHPSSTTQTCAHPDPAAPLQVRITSGATASWHPAAVVHIFRGHLDIAVLQVQGNFPAVSPVQLWPAPLTSATEGLPVTVVGHAMFGPSSGLPPLTTSGNLAKVLTVGDKACMVMTSAAVHSGASGGAVFGPGGLLVGLVTSNARHARGTILPHLNFAIAADELRPLWRLAAQLQGRTDRGKKGEGRAWLKELKSMDVQDPESDRLWSLASQAEEEVLGEGMHKVLEAKLQRLKPPVSVLPLDSHQVQGRLVSKL